MSERAREVVPFFLHPTTRGSDVVHCMVRTARTVSVWIDERAVGGQRRLGWRAAG